MKYALDADTLQALELAKRSVPEGQDLEVGHLLAALVHGTDLATRFPALAQQVDAPRPLTTDAGKRRVSAPLKQVLARFTDQASPASPADLLAAIATSPDGRALLARLGVPAGDVDAVAGAVGTPGAELPTEPSWRDSPQRAEVVEALSAYGRTLTAVDLPPHHLYGVETALRNIMQGLIQRKQHSVVLVGPPGVGKSAVVLEFARRISAGDPIIEPRLRDIDVFELSPAFLKAGASVVGQFEERVKALLQILTAHPKVVVFVDEVHALLQSEMHVQTPFSGASAEFKKAVGSGAISLIGCTTLTEYRHYIEPDKALADRFTQVRIDAPTPEQTVEIMQARLPGLRAYYHELDIPDDIVPITVKLAEDHLLGKFQPRKSIRLLDQACAWCLVQDPPQHEVTEEAVRATLEAQTGHRIVETRSLTAPELYETLRGVIVGQDDLLQELAEAVVLGLSEWKESGKGTRGNFFFAGPTGTGKTETAKVLAEAIGGTGRALIRIDCNTLQGSGWDSREALNTLLGSPPGYIGYVRGEGGLLSQIRDTPEAVVLFDEIEKADPGVGRLLLQILDEGMVEDTEGNPLDFRRAFLLFTSNAGVSYASAKPTIGFASAASTESAAPRTPAATVSKQTVMDDLRRRGFPQEFLGRNFQWFTFRALDTEGIREVLRRQLEAFRATAAQRRPPLEVRWDDAVLDTIVAAWDPQFGVRHLIGLLRNQVIGQVSIADAQGELDGITTIVLRVPTRPAGEPRPDEPSRHREDESLIIDLA